MAPVRGRPLGPLGWLLTLLLELAVGGETELEAGEQDGLLAVRGQDRPVMERKAA